MAPRIRLNPFGAQVGFGQGRPLFLMGSLLAGLTLTTALLVAPASFAASNGEKVYQELREKGQIYNENGWSDYVEAIGHRLLISGGYDVDDYMFMVQDHPEVNAFAMPKGLIVVFRGLLPYLRSEDELAGVIGHEIGHLLAHHVERSRRRARLSQVGGFLGSVATGTSAIWDMTNTIAATLQSGFGREHELEADEYGARFLAQAGYAPYAMIDAIQALKDHELFISQVKRQPKVYHGLFSSHPKSDKRLHELVQQVQSEIPAEVREPVGDFNKMLDGLSFGDESATGLIKDGSYYHSALKVVVSFPEGWDVTNTTAEILARAPGGTDEASIAMQRQNAPATPQTPAEYVKETLKRDDLEGGEQQMINGYPAFIGEIKVVGEGAQRKTIGVLYKDSSVYVFRGEVGPSGDPAAFDALFKSTIESFRAMTADDLRVASSQRIRMVEATPGLTYGQLAARSSIKANGEETLRAINGHHPRGEPRAGDLIKTVQ